MLKVILIPFLGTVLGSACVFLLRRGRHSDIGTVFFAVGFSLMMALDVALG